MLVSGPHGNTIANAHSETENVAPLGTTDTRPKLLSTFDTHLGVCISQINVKYEYFSN